MDRLKASGVKDYRAKQLAAQQGLCSLCRQLVSKDEAVLDHNHKTGECRGVLHRGCNSMLGKIENAMVRYRLTNIEVLAIMLANVPTYLSSSLDILHPTHKTAEEKRLLRNKRARKKRSLTKSGVKNHGEE